MRASSSAATGIGEFDPQARADGWAEDLVNLLVDAHRWVAHRRTQDHTALPPSKLDDLSTRYDRLVEQPLSIHQHRPGKQHRPGTRPYDYETGNPSSYGSPPSRSRTTSPNGPSG